MNILAFDTATEACSAAFHRSDGAVFSRFQIAPRQHQRLLPEMLSDLFEEAGAAKSDLDYCAFGNGPGAFTGIRIAAALAQGIGTALDIPLLPVSTLAVLAQTALDRHPHDQVLVALDARMDEIYWSVYRRNGDGLADRVGDEQLTNIQGVQVSPDIEAGMGHGWLQALREKHRFPIDADLLPDATALLKLAKSRADMGLAVAAGDITINYLRNQVAEKKRN
ncbi:MAG: tRNA (adenosine(37)-N6)-threonylcarbamoyltransferase complex dimerization subunit type 1 TsaB [Pseudomonadota bacterium]